MVESFRRGPNSDPIGVFGWRWNLSETGGWGGSDGSRSGCPLDMPNPGAVANWIRFPRV